MKNEKVIRIALRNGDDTKVKVDFHGGIFTPEEFTSLIMAALETYTVGLLKENTKEAVFTHWNNVFGIFLNKIVPPVTHYDLSAKHKEFKEHVDATLGQEETPEIKQRTEDNRTAAYILAREILVGTGMTEETVDMLITKQLGLLKAPNAKNYEKK